MKLVFSLLLSVLIAGLGAAPVFADADDPGSSTLSDQLAGQPNTDRVDYLNVHSGREVRAADKVGLTDAFVDQHPFSEPE